MSRYRLAVLESETFTPACMTADELEAWRAKNHLPMGDLATRPCHDCLLAYAIEQRAQGTCNGEPMGVEDDTEEDERFLAAEVKPDRRLLRLLADALTPKEEEPMTTATETRDCVYCHEPFVPSRRPGRPQVACTPDHQRLFRLAEEARRKRERHAAASASEVPAAANVAVAEHETEDPAPDDALSVAPQSSDQQVTDDDRNDPVDLAEKAWAVLEATPGFNEELREAEADLAAGNGVAFDEEAKGQDWRRDAFTTALDEAQADYEQAARDAAAAIEARNVAQVAVSYLRAKLASLGEADAA